MAPQGYTTIRSEVDENDVVQTSYVDSRRSGISQLASSSSMKSSASTVWHTANIISSPGSNPRVNDADEGDDDLFVDSKPQSLPTRTLGYPHNSGATLKQTQDGDSQFQRSDRSISYHPSTSTLESDKDWQRPDSASFIQLYRNPQKAFKRIIEPEDHNPSTSTHLPAPAALKWSRRRQRKRLWTLIFAEWFATFSLCLLYIGTLVHFSKQPSIDSSGQKTFNVVTTGIAFLLGVNLTMSLKTYAKMMRWRLLALRWRPLEEVELILSCDGLRNVAKLLLKARGKVFPYYSHTSLLCLLWLLLNVGLALFVAFIGFTYSLDNPAFFNRQKDGNVTFVDLGALKTTDHDADMSAVNSWGIRGLNADISESWDHRHARPYEVQTQKNGTSKYYLQSFNPGDTNTSAISFRPLQSSAQCTSYQVINESIEYENYWGGFTYVDHGAYDSLQNVKFTWLNAPGYGGITVWADMNSSCGWGCTSMWVFLARSLPKSSASAKLWTESRLYACNNTVAPLQYFRHQEKLEATGSSQINDYVARVLAGAVGWSDEIVPYNDENTWKSISYSRATSLVSTLREAGSDEIPNHLEIADFVSTFTTRAVAAIDDVNTGLRMFAHDENGRVPVLSRRLAVDWFAACGLIGGMALGQFLAMVLVFMFATKVVIKDDSPLSIAKLLFNLIRTRGLEKHGCMLKGEDIVASMDNPDVIYGWVDKEQFDSGTGRRLGHIDVFVGVRKREGSGIYKQKKGKTSYQAVISDEGKERVVYTKFNQKYAYD